MAAAEGAILTVGQKSALSLGAAAISAVGAIQQGQAARQSADFEAAQLRQNAIREREIAAQEAQDFENDEARRRATLRARVAGSGTTLEGTPLAVLSDLAGEAEFQRRRILAGGETRAGALETSASVRQLEGRNAQRAGFFKAGGSLLTGASKFNRTTPKPVPKPRVGGAESVGA